MIATILTISPFCVNVLKCCLHYFTFFFFFDKVKFYLLNVSAGSVSQERNPRQRLGGERSEGNLSVVRSEGTAPLEEQQQPVDLLTHAV